MCVSVFMFMCLKYNTYNTSTRYKTIKKYVNADHGNRYKCTLPLKTFKMNFATWF